MKKSALFKTFLVILSLVLPVYPARGELYSWRDQNGVENFSNSRDNIPADAKVQVWTEKEPEPQAEKSNPAPSPPPPPSPSQAENSAPSPLSPSVNSAPARTEPATQGQFAVQLVEELGLDPQPTPEGAAGLLTQIRVSPPLGRWELERPITPTLVTRLRTLTVSAAEAGTISIRPEEALLAFDTTAALLGVPITAGAPADPADPNYTTTVVQSPPLVLIAPPPPVYYTSYVWVPVEPGFFWGGVWCSGYFVFDVGHRNYWFHRHRFDFPRDRIERHFTDHVVGPRLRGHGGFSGTQPLPPRSFDRRTEVRPVAPPPSMERRLRGGASSRSYSTSRGQAVPPSISTPISPRTGRSAPPANQLTPLAPRTPMTPLAPMTPMSGRLRAPAVSRQAAGPSVSSVSPSTHSSRGGRPSLRRG